MSSRCSFTLVALCLTGKPQYKKNSDHQHGFPDPGDSKSPTWLLLFSFEWKPQLLCVLEKVRVFSCGLPQDLGTWNRGLVTFLEDRKMSTGCKPKQSLSSSHMLDSTVGLSKLAPSVLTSSPFLQPPFFSRILCAGIGATVTATEGFPDSLRRSINQVGRIQRAASIKGGRGCDPRFPLTAAHHAR